MSRMDAPSQRTADAASPLPIRQRDPDDPLRRTVELAQRGRMILDVAAADLEAAEALHGPFHETTWHFRNALAEARRSWDRLRAEFGGRALDAALAEAPVVILSLPGGASDEVRAPEPGQVTLIPISGRTYRVECLAETEVARALFRLTRLPPHEDGPYYACRLRDGSSQCDCAEWTYQAADVPGSNSCKHIRALESLGWL